MGLYVNFPLQDGDFSVKSHCIAISKADSGSRLQPAMLNWKEVIELFSCLLPLESSRSSVMVGSYVTLLMHESCSSWTLHTWVGGSAWLTPSGVAVVPVRSPQAFHDSLHFLEKSRCHPHFILIAKQTEKGRWLVQGHFVTLTPTLFTMRCYTCFALEENFGLENSLQIVG